jgi:uncharacterized protein YjhX (UPF0386 family)
MNEIAVISDLVENQKEEEEFLFLKQTKEVKVWYIKTKLPDSDAKYQRYATKPTNIKSGPLTLNGPGLNSTDIETRNGIIQDQINALAREGFTVTGKYISMFISGKIKELILSRKHQKKKIKEHKEVKSKNEQVEGIDDSPLAKLLMRNMQRDS